MGRLHGRIVLISALSIILLGRGVPLAVAADIAPGHYHEQEDWAKLPPGRTWGAVSAIDIDPDGESVWVLDRCVEVGPCSTSEPTPIQKFDKNGNRVSGFGAGLFVSPHGLFVDRDGNVWTTDFQGKDGKGQTVMKFSPNGHVLMVLGRPGVAGDAPGQFNGPSDVVTIKSGEIFVADGHGQGTNARIVKFSKTGSFITSWGKAGSAPGEFGTPHGIAADRDGRIFVADRFNHRTQIFDRNGKFLAAWDQFGDPSGIFIDKNNILYAADVTSKEMGDKRGIRFGNVKDGHIMDYIPMAPVAPESIAVDKAGHMYIGFTMEKALKRLVKD